MRQTLGKGMAAAAAATSILSLYGSPAYADSSASGGAEGSPGIASGNTVQAPVTVPVNVCGNSVNVAALLNPTFGNRCGNTGTPRPRHHDGPSGGYGDTPSDRERSPGGHGETPRGHGGSHDGYGETPRHHDGSPGGYSDTPSDRERSPGGYGETPRGHDGPSVGYGDTPGTSHPHHPPAGPPVGPPVAPPPWQPPTAPPVTTPPTTPGTPPVTHQPPIPPRDVPPQGSSTPPGTPPGTERHRHPIPHQQMPRPSLAETGAEGLFAATAAGAALLAGGAVLYRRTRVADVRR